MNRMNYLSRLTLAGMFILMAGCSMKPASFYQLQAQQQEANLEAVGPAVLLGPVTLADYLQREQIIQRQEDGSLLLSKDGYWAGDLQGNIGQLLLNEMSRQLKSSNVALYPDRIGVEQQAQVILTLSRLDSGPQQPAVMEVQWRVLNKQGKTQETGMLSVEQEHDGSLLGQVKAQEKLLQQLAERLAKQVSAMTRSKAQTNKAEPQSRQSSTITELSPAPEVYRF